jgi:hypothetical protein
VNRLHIHRIVSVGAVENPDNPESEILIFKSGTPTPSGVSSTAGGGGRLRAGPVLSPADRKRLVMKVRLDVMDEKIEALKKTTAESWKTMDEIRKLRGTMTQTMTAEKIAEAVAKRAEALRSDPKFWDKTEVELKAELWKRTPGLKDCYRAAMRDPDGFAKSKSSEHSEAFATIRKWADES